MDPQLHALLVVAAHQVEYSRNPPERTVHEAVEAARALGQGHAAGMVNAVLRRFAAQRGELFAQLDRDAAVASAHPGWMVKAIEDAWPDHWRAVLAANNEHPPLTLRVDLSRTDVQTYLAQLAAAGLQGQALAWMPGAVQLAEPVPVRAIPGFETGLVSVQDVGAQLAAVLLDAQPGMHVLDACAAPGGKTLHILERTAALADLVAVDVDPQRLQRVRENLQRAGREATLLALDVARVADGQAALPAPLALPFDRILLDAPCSASGVIRRHPDIKLLRRQGDLATLAQAQLAILRQAWGLLAPAGRLLYGTCSVFPVENEAVIERFLSLTPDARVAPGAGAAMQAPGAIGLAHGVQLLPGAEAGADGFYYACLVKS
jgi:16S rRNA (cytosine967-C5)-methyltransferase